MVDQNKLAQLKTLIESFRESDYCVIEECPKHPVSISQRKFCYLLHNNRVDTALVLLDDLSNQSTIDKAREIRDASNACVLLYEDKLGCSLVRNGPLGNQAGLLRLGGAIMDKDLLEYSQQQIEVEKADAREEE